MARVARFLLVFRTMRPDGSFSATLRFAPSPNGALHLGHAYSALRNEQAAAELNGRLLLRMEDLDHSRCRPEFEAAILEDLGWLGLAFERPFRRQSEHEGDYAAALERLSDFVYPCFCSRAEAARASVGEDPDGASLYSGRCRLFSSDERGHRLARGEKAAWRLDMRAALDAIDDARSWVEFGEEATPVECRGTPEVWGDVILRGRGLAASYHLAATVDDALQGVTDVVRGRDLLPATSVHRLLQALLKLPTPRYRHHRVALDREGGKLSKSRRSASLGALRRQGVSPGEIRAALGFARGHNGGIAVAIS